MKFKIICGAWAALCFAGVILSVATVETNVLISLAGLIPTGITAVICFILGSN